MQGTAAYALIWSRPATAPDSLSAPLSSRFNGRVSLRVARGLYLGVSAGSWKYVPTNGRYNPEIGQLSVAVATAVVASSYAQFYPLRSIHFFARGGFGYANTATYTPAQVSAFPAPLTEDRHTRFSATAGWGIDIPLRAHFAVTASADYTRLFGSAAGFEAIAALQVGLGVTVR